MMPLSTLSVLVLVGLLLLAAVSDLRTRRLPNLLTLGGLLLGVLLGAARGGWPGAADALLGAAAGFAVFFFVYLLGGMGAGDVKLMAAVGSFLGVPLVLWAAVCSALAGGLLAVIFAVHRRALRKVLSNAGRLLSAWAYSGRPRRVEWISLSSPGIVKVPYGVAIAVGASFVALFPESSIF